MRFATLRPACVVCSGWRTVCAALRFGCRASCGAVCFSRRTSYVALRSGRCASCGTRGACRAVRSALGRRAAQCDALHSTHTPRRCASSATEMKHPVACTFTPTQHSHAQGLFVARSAHPAPLRYPPGAAAAAAYGERRTTHAAGPAQRAELPPCADRTGRTCPSMDRRTDTPRPPND